MYMYVIYVYMHYIYITYICNIEPVLSLALLSPSAALAYIYLQHFPEENFCRKSVSILDDLHTHGAIIFTQHVIHVVLMKSCSLNTQIPLDDLF